MLRHTNQRCPNHETKKELKQRLGRDSFRAFNACFLCLQVARDPVACQQGHLACKECMYESILSQRQAIMRQQQLNEQKLREEQEKKLAEEEQAKLAMLASFERTQTSVLPDERRKPATESTESGVHNRSASRESSKEANTPIAASASIGKSIIKIVGMHMH
jgi:nitric oxide synthase-interacting protein